MVEEMGRKVVYELLAILDFNNVRKRMSVIGEDEAQSPALSCQPNVLHSSAHGSSFCGSSLQP